MAFIDIKKLEEIEERAKVATPGPWSYDGIPYNESDDPVIYRKGVKDGYIAQTVYDQQSCTQKHNVDGDTIFIANTRQDIPFLCDTIRKMLSVLDDGDTDILERLFECQDELDEVHPDSGRKITQRIRDVVMELKSLREKNK